MKVYEIGTGYTPIPATMGAATEIVVEELTKAFMKMDVPVEIVDIKAKERKAHALPITEVWVPGFFAGTDVKLGIMHKLKRVVYSVCLAQKLKKILKAANEKIVLHFHNQYNMFFFLKLVPQKLREKALVAYTVHSHVWHGRWKDIEKTIKERYFQELYCINKADSVFVLNQTTMTNMIQNAGVDQQKVRMIDNGVNMLNYRPLSSEEKVSVRGKTNLNGRKVFIQVGSVCERKNQLKALELLMPFMKQDKNIMFVYAGGIIDSEYQERIKEIACVNKIAQQVQYWGEIAPGKELNDLYNIAEAMVFPSKAEGFSLVILEAMAAGIPVMISKELEFLLADECLRFGNEREFYELITQQVFISEQRSAIGEKSREVIEQNYSWSKIAKDYFEGWKC